MALPARFAHLDGLVDLLVDQLIEDLEAEMRGPENENAPGGHDSAGGINQSRHEQPRRGALRVADHTPVPPGS